MVQIIQGATSKPISSGQLAECFESYNDENGILYTGYPIFATPEGRFPIDAIYMSPQRGIIVFDIIEGRTIDENFAERQDDAYNKLEAKLRNHKVLMKGRTLQVPICVLTFAPAVTNIRAGDTDHPIRNAVDLLPFVQAIDKKDFNYYPELVSVIQSISTIRKGRKKRILQRDDSRGSKLKRLEDSIANLDNNQSKAVIETANGVQRIRGLAGSGKTIVLALKAAYLHAQHPDWKIAVTFNTRSLKGQFRQLINTFVIEQTNEEPDWENLCIMHAWGAPGGGERDGIYYSFCRENDVEYFDFGNAKQAFGRNNEFNGACQKALDSLKAISKVLFDVILIDEAQDFPPSFLLLAYELLSSKKLLVYAYDELQNLNSVSLPPPEEIFGRDADGSSRVRLEQANQDVILDKCYRNSRPVLSTAHALGFGIYRKKDPETGTGLVQMFDQHTLWKEVGYTLLDGQLRDGASVTLCRTENSSPTFLENHSPIDDLIQFIAFDNEEEQAQWLCNAIVENIRTDELRSDDIVVINPDPVTTKRSVGPIRKLLYNSGIETHLAGVDTTPDVFFQQNIDSVAFTGIFRAKGNEAGMVYIINAHDCFSSFGRVASVRNQLFTAITRSKGWVRVLGVGKGMRNLISEFLLVKENDFKLKFRYPTEAERKHLYIVNRDMSEEEKRKVKRGKSGIEELLKDLESGNIYLEDLGEEQLRKLRALLNSGDNRNDQSA